MPTAEPVIILFDGVCNFCNASVDRLIRLDRDRRFRFASQQSPIGQRLLQEHGQLSRLTSVVVIDEGRVYTRSAAMYRIGRHLPWPWPLLQLVAMLPRPLTDWMYDLVAVNRYRLFGRMDACRVPTPDVASRFLA